MTVRGCTCGAGPMGLHDFDCPERYQVTFVEPGPLSVSSPVLEQTHEHTGTWTPEMRRKLSEQYVQARADGKLRALAAELGVDLYQLYSQAHRLGLSREIRRR